jgi:hypothetical protein
MAAVGKLKNSDRWYVTNGTTAVGPVDLDLLARGIEAGKVPLTSFVRNERWTVWRQLSELMPRGGALDPKRTLRSAAAMVPSTDDVASSSRPARADEKRADDVFAGASDVREALLLLLSAAVQQGDATVALVHEVGIASASIVCAHGKNMFKFLGAATSLLDPMVLEAASGSGAIVSRDPEASGHVLLKRLEKLGDETIGDGFMLPIRPHGRLLGFLEIGRPGAFRADEAIAVGVLVEALVATIEASGWAKKSVPS